MAGLIAILLVALLLGAATVLGFGFGTRALMRSKGRSGAAGFCLGIFLGVFGLLIAALLPETPEHQAERLHRQMVRLNAPVAVDSTTAVSPVVAPVLGPPKDRVLVPAAILLGFSNLLWIVAKFAFGLQRRGGQSDLFVYSMVALSGVFAVLSLAKRSRTLVCVGAAVRMAIAGMGFWLLLGHVGEIRVVVWFLADLLAAAVFVLLVVDARIVRPKERWSELASAAAVVGGVLTVISTTRLRWSDWQYDLTQTLFVAIPLVAVVVVSARRTREVLLLAGAFVALILDQAIWSLDGKTNPQSQRRLDILGWSHKVDVLWVLLVGFVLVLIGRELLAVQREEAALRARVAAAPLPPPSAANNPVAPAFVGLTPPVAATMPFGSATTWSIPATQNLTVSSAKRDRAIVIWSLAGLFVLLIPAIVVPLALGSSGGGGSAYSSGGDTDSSTSGDDGSYTGDGGAVEAGGTSGQSTAEDGSSSTGNDPGGTTSTTTGATESSTSTAPSSSGVYSFVETGEIGFQDGKPVRTVAISPDQSAVLSAGLDGRAVIWDLNGYGRRLDTVASRKKYLYEAAYSADGRYVATAGEDDTVSLLDLESRSTPCGEPFFSESEGIDAVRFFPAGEHSNWLVTAGQEGVVRVWNIDSCSLVRELPVGLEVFAVDVDRDGGLLAAAAGDKSSGAVRIWDVASGFTELRSDFVGHRKKVRDVTFSPDGRLLVSTSLDHTAAVWDMATLTRVATLDHLGYVQEASFSSDGRYLVTTQDKDVPQVWDVQSMNPDSVPQRVATLASDRVWSAVFVPGTYTIVTGGYDGTIRRWEPAG